MFREITRLLGEKWRVDHEERLLRDGRIEALRTGSIGAGEIECAEKSRQILAFDEGVNGPARRERTGGDFDGLAALLEFEPAGDLQDAVTERLKFQAAAIHSPNEAIGRIFFGVVWIFIAALLISIRKQDQAMQFLERPAVLHEPGGEIIEQFRMS